MKTELFSDRIGVLVGNDNLKEAIQELAQLLKDSPKLDGVIMQSAQLSDLQKQIRDGTITFDNMSISKNRIRIAILSLAEEINEQISSNSELKGESKALSEKKGSKTIIKQKHSGSGDNVGGNKIINN